MKARDIVIVAALVLVGLSSIAYAAYVQILTISGSSTSAGNWDVEVTSITQTNAVGATENSAPQFTGTSATFDVDLAYPGATATYEIVITNNGTIPGKIATVDGVTGITEANAAVPTYVGYEETGIAADTIITANGGTNTATVTVTWDPDSEPSEVNASKTATITFNYEQYTPTPTP